MSEEIIQGVAMGLDSLSFLICFAMFLAAFIMTIYLIVTTGLVCYLWRLTKKWKKELLIILPTILIITLTANSLYPLLTYECPHCCCTEMSVVINLNGDRLCHWCNDFIWQNRK